jgi:hypothetical protein
MRILNYPEVSSAERWMQPWSILTLSCDRAEQFVTHSQQEMPGERNS